MSKRQLSVGRPLVWVGIAVLSAGLAAGAWFLKSSGIEAGVKGANRVAASTVKKDLAPSLTASEVREPMSEEASAELQRVVQARILDDNPGMRTIRIWTANGTLIYSSAGERTGTNGGDDRRDPRRHHRRGEDHVDRARQSARGPRHLYAAPDRRGS